MPDYRELAKMYRLEGFACVPVNSDKRPGVPAGSDHLYTPLPIDEYFISYGIAISCGKVSSGFEAIDFDKHNGQNIDSIYEQIMSSDLVAHMINEGKLSVAQTRSGGYHFYIKSEYSKTSGVLAKWEDNSTMIEIKSSGSYIIVPPTAGYKHLLGVEIIKLDICEQEERTTLIDLCKSYTKTALNEDKKQSEIKSWASKWNSLTSWGQYNMTAKDKTRGLLLEAGWSVAGNRGDGVELWRRPGKHKGISATFGMYENMFYVFSSNAHPFQEGKAYTPTDVLMLLKFNGDWEATKNYLYKLYKVEKVEIAKQNTQIEFPIDVFPTHIGMYINELNRTHNYKKDFLAVAFMFTMATVNGNLIKLRVKNDWLAATTFWFAVVGNSGVMKTHPINSMIKPLKNIDLASKDKYDYEKDQYERLDAKDKKDAQRPFYKQLLIEDFTIEACSWIHKHNPKGLGLFKDELIGFINDMNKYRKGSDEQFWLQSFNNSSYVVNRVTKEPLVINDIMINIIGSIQTTLLQQVMISANGNGLIERFLFTSKEDNIYPQSIDDISIEWIKWYNNSIIEIEKLFVYSKEPKVIDMTLEARQLMIKFDTELCAVQSAEDTSFNIRNYINKIKTYLPRFALLTCIIDVCFEGGRYEVTEVHMNKAIRLAKYFIESAKFIFDEIDRLDEIKTVNKFLRSKGLAKGEQIIQLYNKQFKQADIARQLNVTSAYVSKVLKNNGGNININQC